MDPFKYYHTCNLSTGLFNDISMHVHGFPKYFLHNLGNLSHV